MRVLPALVLMLACASSVAAPTYRWTDAEGRVHYAQTPPTDAKYEVIKPHAPAPRPPVAPATAPVPAAAAEADADAKTQTAPPPSDMEKFLQEAEAERKKKNEARAKQAAEREDAERHCAQWRTRLAFLEQQRVRLVVPQADGSTARMNDTQFNERRSEATGQIDKHCQ